MTRKDFIVTAKVAADLGHQIQTGEITITGLFEAFADLLALTNPLFNREKFLDRCEMELDYLNTYE